MQEVIVSGANSFVGSAVVKKLLLHGIKVKALCRLGRTANLPQHENLSVVPFDMTKIDELNLSKKNMMLFTILHGLEELMLIIAAIIVCNSKMHNGLWSF